MKLKLVFLVTVVTGVLALPAAASAATDLQVTIVEKGSGEAVDRHEVKTLWSDASTAFDVERIVRITNVGTTNIEKPAYRIFGTPEEPGYKDCLTQCFQVGTDLEWGYADTILTPGQFFEVEVGFFPSLYPESGETLSGQIGVEATKVAVWNESILNYEVAPLVDATDDNVWLLEYTQAWRYAYIGLPPVPYVGAKPFPANTPSTIATHLFNQGPDTFQVPFYFGIWGSGDVTVHSVTIDGEEPVSCEPGLYNGYDDTPGYRCRFETPLPGNSTVPVTVSFQTAGGWGNVGLTLALGLEPIEGWFETSRDERYLKPGVPVGGGDAENLERAWGVCSKSADPSCGDGYATGPQDLWIVKRKVKLSGKKAKIKVECFYDLGCAGGKATATGKAVVVKKKKGKKVKKKTKVKFTCQFPAFADVGGPVTATCKLPAKTAKLIKKAKKVDFTVKMGKRQLGSLRITK